MELVQTSKEVQMAKFISLILIILNCNKSIKDLTLKNKIEHEYWEYIKKDEDEELNEFLEKKENKSINLNTLINQEGETSLTLAAKHNSLEVLKILLSKKSINIDALNEKNQTSLVVSILEAEDSIDRDEIIDILIRKGADVNSQYGMNADNVLMLAIRKGDSYIVNKILKKNSYIINKQNMLGETPLILAINSNIDRDSKEKIIKELLGNKKLNLNIKDCRGYPALIYAILKEDFDNVLSLILSRTEESLDLNAQDEFGKTALMYAIEKRNHKLVYLLLKEKVDLNIKDINNQKTFVYLLEKFDKNILSLFKEIKNLKEISFDIHLCCEFIFKMIYNLENNKLDEVYEFFKLNSEDKNEEIFKVLVKCTMNLAFEKISLLENFLIWLDSFIDQEKIYYEKYLSPTVQKYNSVLIFKAFENKNLDWLNCFFNKLKNLKNRDKLFNLFEINEKNQSFLILAVLNEFNNLILSILDILKRDNTKIDIIKYFEHKDNEFKNALDYNNNILKIEYENIVNEDDIKNLNKDEKSQYYLYKGALDEYRMFLKNNFEDDDLILKKTFHFLKLIKENQDTIALKILEEDELNLKLTYGDEGLSAIHYAALYGKVKLFEKILEKDSSQTNLKDKEDNTPLIHLIKTNSIKQADKIKLIDKILKSNKVLEDINLKNKDGHNALSIACLKGDYEIVNKLINLKNIDLHIKNNKNESLVQIILSSLTNSEMKEYQEIENTSHLSIIKILLRKDATLGNGIFSYISKDNYIAQYLLKILESNEIKNTFNLEELHSLIKQGDVKSNLGINDKEIFNGYSKEGKTSLHYAVASPLILDKILRVDQIDVNAHKGNGLTPLVEAILSDNLESIKILVKDKRVNVNLLFENNDTPLMLALYHNLEAVNLILTRDDIKVYLRNKNGETAFDMAINLEYREIASKILSKNRGNIILSPYDEENLDKVQKTLIERGVQNEDFPIYIRSFFEAAKRGYSEIIEMSLEKNLVEKNYIDEYLYALSKIGIEKEDLELLEIIIKFLGNVNRPISKDYPKRYLIHKAIKKSKTKVLKWLLSKDVNLNITYTPKFEKDKNNRDFSCLNLACKLGHIEIVKLLLDQGVKINFNKDYYNEPPLIIAAEKGKFEIVKLLLEMGSEVNAPYQDFLNNERFKNYGHYLPYINRGRKAWDNKAPSGWTALMAASFNGHLEVVEILLKYGADVDAHDDVNNYTALTYAASQSHLEVLKLILESNPKNVLQALNETKGDNYSSIIKLLLSKEVSDLVFNYDELISKDYYKRYPKEQFISELIIKAINADDIDTINSLKSLLERDEKLVVHMRKKEVFGAYLSNVDWLTLLKALERGYIEIIKAIINRSYFIKDLLLNSAKIYPKIEEEKLEKLMKLLDEAGIDIHS